MEKQPLSPLETAVEMVVMMSKRDTVIGDPFMQDVKMAKSLMAGVRNSPDLSPQVLQACRDQLTALYGSSEKVTDEEAKLLYVKLQKKIK